MTLVEYKKVFLKYAPIESFATGIELSGQEVKSLRDKLGSLDVGKTANIVIANGAPCETLLDADDPVGFDNAADAPITDVFLAPCLPRVSQGEAVEAIRARIRARALVNA